MVLGLGFRAAEGEWFWVLGLGYHHMPHLGLDLLHPEFPLQMLKVVENRIRTALPLFPLAQIGPYNVETNQDEARERETGR